MTRWGEEEQFRVRGDVWLSGLEIFRASRVSRIPA